MRILIICYCIMFLGSSSSFGWNAGGVLDSMSVNITKPGVMHDQMAGHYSGGSISMRVENKNFAPISFSPPSMRMGCSGIDMFAGSFSVFKGQELVNMAKRMASQAASYGFQLALKTYAPQIERTMTDLREMAMDLNKFSVNECQATKSLYASVLSKNSAMYETVCQDIEQARGSKDYFGARKSCADEKEAKKKARLLEEDNPELLLVNYNLLMKVAQKIGIDRDSAIKIMNITGTIVMRDGKSKLYESLLKSNEGWIGYLSGGNNIKVYECRNKECTDMETSTTDIEYDNAYQGKTEKILLEIRSKLISNEPFSNTDINFLSLAGQVMPIYDYISFEAITGHHLIDKGSEIVSIYLILQYVQKIIQEVLSGANNLISEQLSDNEINKYIKNLRMLENFIAVKYRELSPVEIEMQKRLRLLEAHELSRIRG